MAQSEHNMFTKSSQVAENKTHLQAADHNQQGVWHTGRGVVPETVLHAVVLGVPVQPHLLHLLNQDLGSVLWLRQDYLWYMGKS